MKSYTLKLVEIKKETADTITLCFKQPALRKVKYLAGQYLTLIFRINGRRYIRPYSFSSAPGIDPYLEVTVKRVLNGVVSNHIHDEVKVGDSIESMEPMGDFTISEGALGNIYFWGAGSGITPLISLIKSQLFTGYKGQITLVYGSRNADNTIFFSQLSNLMEQFKNQFQVKYFHTHYVVDENNPTTVQGRIDYDQALRILATDSSIAKSRHYICGPSGLKESVKSALFSLKIDESNVFSEDFELVKNPKDFEHIQTQHIKLKFQQQEFELEVAKGKSILEAALDAQIELAYSCQTGNCSTCKGSLVNGKAKMIGLVKERDDLQHNEYLLCCTHPLTEDVYIEI